MKDKLIWLAIDGPAGSGKSTVAKKLLEYFPNFIHINTGAMYRALAYFLVQNDIDINCDDAIEHALPKCHIHLAQDQVFLVDDNNAKIDITDKIYNEQIAKLSSQISQLKFVREKLVDEQRIIAQSNNVIMDGRDIGTVVLPDANLKIYLDASINKRAERRFHQLAIHNKADKSIADIAAEIVSRDTNDKQRQYGALKVANDAIVVNTDNLTIEQCCQTIAKLLKEKLEQ